jgi:hypothetical protein
MLILFDNGIPAPLRYALKGHTVVEAIERGWDTLANGELLAVAEAAGFEVLLTTDKNMRYQQNLKGRKIVFVVLGTRNGRSCAGTLKGSLSPLMRPCRAATPKWTSLSGNAPRSVS